MKKSIKNPTTWQAVFLIAAVCFAIIEGML